MSAPIPANLAVELLDLARTLKHEGFRAILLTKLIPVLPPTWLGEALAIARMPLDGRSRDDGARAGLLLTLAGRLRDTARESVLDAALNAARAVRHHQQRAAALGSIADALPERARRSVIDEALAAARAIASAEFRAQALAGVAVHLPGQEGDAIHTEALAVAAGVADDWGRAAALAWLAPSLPIALLPTALSTVREIGKARQRAAALAALAARAPEPTCNVLLAEAFGAVRTVADPGFRAETLAELVDKLDGPLQAEAVRVFADSAAHLARPELLGKLPAFFHTIAHLDPPSGLQEVHRALRDVGKWFG